MTVREWIDHLHGHPTGHGRGRAPCPNPVHLSNSPKLSIRKGRDGRTLLHCFAGCDVQDVVRSAGLSMSDLFSGPPPTLEQRQRMEIEHKRREAVAKARRRRRIRINDRYRELTNHLHQLIQTMGLRLAQMPEGPEGDELAVAYHAACDQLHKVDAMDEGEGAAQYHHQLSRWCKENRIDIVQFLAPYTDENADGDIAQPRHLRADAPKTTWRRTEIDRQEETTA